MRITGRTRLAGIMGWPVTHSRSPALHNFWIDEHGIDGAYVPLPVAPEHLAQALRALPVLGFRGCNLTLPHKQAALAIVAALIEARVEEIRLVNRTLARAERLARDLAAPATRITIHPWSERDTAQRDAGLLVNTTSLGMTGEPELDIDLTPLPLPAVVVDIVYVPLETTLLAVARKRGHPTVDGLGMLLHQGRPGFEAWFGRPVQVTRELRAAVLTTLGATMSAPR